mmetsp:Transcript_38156/g.89530  ORF Transcript_38156/g.89530 Transcript_38156/m.89530 type:complete len:135 (+) Transcript_38156:74-478(+)
MMQKQKVPDWTDTKAFPCLLGSPAPRVPVYSAWGGQTANRTEPPTSSSEEGAASEDGTLGSGQAGIKGKGFGAKGRGGAAQRNFGDHGKGAWRGSESSFARQWTKGSGKAWGKGAGRETTPRKSATLVWKPVSR